MKDFVDVSITIPATPTNNRQLDKVIRAHEEGDGATIHEHRYGIMAWLKELRRLRGQS